MAKTKNAPKPTAQMLADYSAFPDDQPVTEHYAAARLAKSRAWLQLKRVTGGGPKFHRTATGMIFYRKSDVEEFLSRDLTAFASTSQYPA